MKLGIGIYILTSEAEPSQHTKAIDFSARPPGFYRAMVPNLPYFMVTVVMDMSSESVALGVSTKGAERRW